MLQRAESIVLAVLGLGIGGGVFLIGAAGLGAYFAQLTFFSPDPLFSAICLGIGACVAMAGVWQLRR